MLIWSSEDEEADEKGEVKDDGIGIEGNESYASRSDDEVSMSEVCFFYLCKNQFSSIWLLPDFQEGPSIPPSPQSEIKKRRSRRADADYVIVKK